MNYRTHQRTVALTGYDRQPRERLVKYGSSGLSDLDLITILLGSGNRTTPVHKLADRVLSLIDSRPETLTIEELKAISGIGAAKSSLLIAALELGRRLGCTSKRQILTPSDAYPMLRHYADRQQEHFIRISLNGAHEVISIGVVSIGLVNRTIVHPREVFATPIKERATALIVAHNHPSGHLVPSHDDDEVTQRLRECGRLLGIQILDHIIFSESSYYSYLEKESM